MLIQIAVYRGCHPARFLILRIIFRIDAIYRLPRVTEAFHDLARNEDKETNSVRSSKIILGLRSLLTVKTVLSLVRLRPYRSVVLDVQGNDTGEVFKDYPV